MNVNLRTTLTRSTLVVELSHDPRWPGQFMGMVARAHADREARRSGYVDAGVPVRTELVRTHGGSHRTRWVFTLPRATLYAVPDAPLTA